MNTERLWTRDFVVGTLANFVLIVNYYMLMVVMTVYVLDVYDVAASLAASCASIFIVGTLIARFVSGICMERIGRKRLLMIGVICEIAFSALYLVGTALPLLFCIRFLHGLSYGICSTTLATIVTSIVPRTRKGEGIGYYMLSVTLGAAIGPFIGIFISNNLDFRLLFILATAVAVLALLAALIIQMSKGIADKVATGGKDMDAAEDEALASEIGDSELGEELLERDASTNPRPLSEKAAPKPKRTSWMDRFIERNVIPISFVCSLIFFGYSSLLTFLTPYAEDMGLARAASVFFIVYALIMFITRPFTGKAFDRKGPKPVMIPAFISFAIGMVMLSFATNDWVLLGSALFLGFGVGTIQSCGLAMAVRATADARLSLANSTFYILIDTGVGVGPMILGLMVPLMGYRAMFQCMAVVALVGLAIFLVITRGRNERQAL